MRKQKRGLPDNWWRLVFPHGKLVAKSGPVASVLSECVCVSRIWLHPRWGVGVGGGDNGNTARAPSKWSTVFHIHCVQGRRHVARKQFKNCSQQMDPLDAIIYSFKTMVVMCTRALAYFSLDVLFKKRT